MKSESLTTSDWDQVVSDFRRLCMLRHQGNVAESDEILSTRLPKRIATWSRTSTQDPIVKKTTLEDMFRNEQKRVEDAMLFHEIASTRWETQLIPMLCNQVSQEIRRTVSDQFSAYEAQFGELNAGRSANNPRIAPKIAFENIPGIIDYLSAEDRKPAGLNKRVVAA
ncbi:MAG: hypothetical protein WCT12_15715 [Verrucomicrobiota bacterium]